MSKALLARGWLSFSFFPLTALIPLYATPPEGRSVQISEFIKSSMCQGLAAIKRSSTSTKPQPAHFHGPIMNLSEPPSSGRRETRLEEDAYKINHLEELLHGDEIIIRSILTNMVLAQGISHISAPSVTLAFS